MREPAPTLLAGLGALLLVGALLTAYQVAGTSYNPRRALLETQEGDGTGLVGVWRQVHHPPRAAPTSPSGTAGDDVLQRFAWATRYINETRGLGLYPQWQCPDALKIGARPARHTPDLVGTTCEPWLSRHAITLLHMLLAPGTAKALEWSTGSSTAWLLAGHVRSLVSIEHYAGWAKGVTEQLESVFGASFLKDRWTLHHVPPEPANSTLMEDSDVFFEYVDAAFLGPDQLMSFDFVSIDGRARAACFTRALRLLHPHGGVLLLDNAERSYYADGIAQVPRHWLRYEAANDEDTTIVWVSRHAQEGEQQVEA
ncbi:glycosyl transferase [Micractinium conductrix]|uniref:Glycosyl transferase n=1 Tax=Micractinium conductrix TaxID=554055 RepID=A0A2P6V637_9CHLO|nr:glycosyl transferase [Micractinium conductrix]|eukprot:PSC69551.1 glycosyl transferase [Micractinium conductrix]